MKTEREEGAAEGGDTQDHTFSKLTLKHSALIKAQVPLFTGGISLSLSLYYSMQANSPNPRAVSNDGAS